MGVLGAVAGIGSALIGASASKSAAKTSAAASDRAAQVQWDIYDQTREDQAPWRDVGQGALYQLADLYGLPYPGAGGGDTSGTTTQQQTQAAGTPISSNGTDLIARYFDEKNAYDNRVISSENDPVFPSLSQWLQNNQPTTTTPQQGSTQTEPVPTNALTPEQRQQNAMARFFTSPDYQFRLNEGQKAIERSAAARGGVLSGATVKGLENYAGNLASGEYQNYKNSLASLAGIGQTANQSLANAGLATAANVGQAYQNAGNARASGYLGQANTISNALNNYQMLNAINGGGGGFGGLFTPQSQGGGLIMSSQLMGGTGANYLTGNSFGF